MTNFTYRKAILSFSLDLTDPDDRPFPVAALLVGRLGNKRVGVAAVYDPGFEGLDPVAREHIGDAIEIIKDHMREQFAGRATDLPEAAEILQGLQSSLRNSLHVSSIGGEEVQLVEDVLAKQESMQVATAALLDAMKQYIADCGDDAPETEPDCESTRSETQMWNLPLSAATHQGDAYIDLQ